MNEQDSVPKRPNLWAPAAPPSKTERAEPRTPDDLMGDVVFDEREQELKNVAVLGYN